MEPDKLRSNVNDMVNRMFSQDVDYVIAKYKNEQIKGTLFTCLGFLLLVCYMAIASTLILWMPFDIKTALAVLCIALFTIAAIFFTMWLSRSVLETGIKYDHAIWKDSVKYHGLAFDEWYKRKDKYKYAKEALARSKENERD